MGRPVLRSFTRILGDWELAGVSSVLRESAIIEPHFQGLVLKSFFIRKTEFGQRYVKKSDDLFAGCARIRRDLEDRRARMTKSGRKPPSPRVLKGLNLPVPAKREADGVAAMPREGVIRPSTLPGAGTGALTSVGRRRMCKQSRHSSRELPGVCRDQPPTPPTLRSTKATTDSLLKPQTSPEIMRLERIRSASGTAPPPPLDAP